MKTEEEPHVVHFVDSDGQVVDLTPAQMKIMECIARGNIPIIGVAQQLNLKRSTVYTQIQRINKRIGARHWLEALLRYQMIRPGPEIALDFAMRKDKESQ